MTQRLLAILMATLMAMPMHAQLKPKHSPIDLHGEAVYQFESMPYSVPQGIQPFRNTQDFLGNLQLSKPVSGNAGLRVFLSAETGTPYLIKGNFEIPEGRSPAEQATDYFGAVGKSLQLEQPEEELILSELIEEGHFSHLRFQQKWKGVPVYGGEAILHKKVGAFYLFNGRYFPTPKLENVEPELTSEEAAALALTHVSQFTNVKPLTPQELLLTASGQTETKLVIFHPEKNKEAEVLAYHVKVVPNLAHRYSYFVNAKTGDIISYHSELCQLTGHHHFGEACEHSNESAAVNMETPQPPPPPGPETAFATDLLGQSRLINVYEEGGGYYMIDASRSMFNFGQSDIPNEPVGVIWSIDGQNNSPQNTNFQAANIISSNNNWNNPTAVSAHYNGGRAYEYFKETFGRESINGNGGNIISLINITETDGSGMDNAFWNGAAMFYGNGNQAFTAPLAKSPDVAGHEMSHGVIQATANLEYLGESGALNESFADVFGVMIDRDDWKLGEDVVNTNIFSTGALRDMENPNNGGNGLNDPGWQPDHYSERYTGTQDNGGVHINSGIPNKAFQLFATEVGKDNAEQVYYRALSQYLVKSSQFIDCRIAVVQAASDLFGQNSAEVTAAENAFTAVGIGQGSGTNTQNDVGSNPGEEYVLFSDDDYSSLYIFTPDGDEIANPLANESPLSRPSITDDGTRITYVGTDNHIKLIDIDWGANTASLQTFTNQPIWRQVAISKDGRRLAALTTDFDNELVIYDFEANASESFFLYNPTTGQGGPSTGDVQYADVLEWDFTGEWVMYDALNSISTTSGTNIEYWDISFAQVWNGAGNDFADPADFFVSKLFSQLPEDVSVGNPTFSKNSDYIIAFDYFDEFNDEYFLLGANVETGDVGTIFENGALSWPSFSPDDSQVLFDAADTFGTPVIGRIDLANDKITAASGSNGTVFFDQARWGVWFANGERNLTSTEEAAPVFDLRVFPNPVQNEMNLEFQSGQFGEAEMRVFDLMGQSVMVEKFTAQEGQNRHQFFMESLPSGHYFLKLLLPEGEVAVKIER